MEVTEYDRHQLFVWFEEHMGPERAATMMNLTPPVGWFDLATKHDLAELEDRIDGRFTRLESRIDTRLAEVETTLTRTYVTWLLASHAAVVAILGGIIGLLAI